MIVIKKNIWLGLMFPGMVKCPPTDCLSCLVQIMISLLARNIDKGFISLTQNMFKPAACI